jgi:hypothetical protein
MSVGIKSNEDGSGAIQVGGSDAITISTSLNTTFVGTASVTTGTLYPIVSSTAVTCAGQTSIDFANIPSWVKRITVMFTGVSTSGTSDLYIRLGTGATPTYANTGYVGQANYVSSTAAMSTGYIANPNIVAANVYSGTVTFNNINANTWCGSGIVAPSVTGNNGTFSGGYVTLSAALTAVRITTFNGTDTFDTTPSAGTINIFYE